MGKPESGQTAGPASVRLANMAVEIDMDRFAELVDDALDQIPAALLEKIENCVWMIEEEPEPDDPGLLGLYDGVPLSERGLDYGPVLPDRIVIYRGPLQRMCADEDELAEQIRITVWHEVAHYFGIEDDELDELGYA